MQKLAELVHRNLCLTGNARVRRPTRNEIRAPQATAHSLRETSSQKCGIKDERGP